MDLWNPLIASQKIKKEISEVSPALIIHAIASWLQEKKSIRTQSDGFISLLFNTNNK